MELDIIGGNYQGRYQDVNPQRTINWYVVNQALPENDKTKHSLFATPGLTLKWSPTGSKVRGLFVANTLTKNRCFAVVDDTLYELFKDGTSTSLGTLSNSVGSQLPIYMTVNSNDQVGIFDGSTADHMDTYTFLTSNGTLIGNCFDMTTDTLTAITDVNFPSTTADRGRVYWSAAADILNWAASDVFTPTFKSDAVTRIFCFRNDIYCFGKESLEIYMNTGSTFERRDGTSLNYGLVAPHSVAAYSNGLIFLGRSSRGQPAVYELTYDYKVTPISPHSVTWQIGKNVHLEDCTAYIQENKEGHIFYYLHIPGADTTLVYDSINHEWHERKSSKPYTLTDGTREQGMFRGNCYVNWDGLQIFGDRYSGNIFLEDYSVFTENSLPIIRQRDSIIYTTEYKALSINQLEMDINGGTALTSGQGSAPQLMFSISKDKGITYQQERFIPLGVNGQYNFRVRIHGVGTSNHWGFRWRLSDPVSCCIVGATMTGSVGVS